MAPPLTRAPRAASRRRRSAGDLVIGLLAIAALAALTAGVPFALVTVFGLPIPHAMPPLSLLTHQLTVPAILKVLSVVVWLAWIQLVCCVIAEIRAAVRNAGMPRRVPLAGGTQALVHRLVTAALLVFAATTALSPALAHQAPAVAHAAGAGARAGGGIPAGARPGSGRSAAPTASPTTSPAASPARQPGGRDPGRPAPARSPRVAHPPGAGKIYVVKPPVGRFHESLWEIAQKYLGDGRRYREIFELNSGRIQPDGSRLTIASLIRPGWVLHMPGDAHGPGLEVIPARDAGPRRPAGEPRHAARPSQPDRPARPAHAAHPAHAARVDHAAHSADAARGDQASRPARPAHAARPDHAAGADHAAGERRTGRPAPASGSAAAFPHPGQLTYPEELAGAALLASGILAALGRRRREQLWQRAFGRRVIAPGGQAALAESALLAGAHEPSARLLDRGLRYLSHAMSRDGRMPPAVVAAHLSHDNLDLWVSPAAPDPPAPWTAVGDGDVWRLPSTAIGRVDDTGMAGGSLYPGLVSLGTDGAGRVLVDLEAAHGVISVTGPQTITIAVLAAMAMELATSRWSDRMRLTLAGFGEDLTPLAPDRIIVVPTLEEALLALEEHASDVAGAMAVAGVGSVLEGRSLGLDPDAWIPHYLISAVPPSPRERSRLLTLARAGRAAAAGYVIAGDVPGASWAWEVTPEGRLLAAGLGFEVQAQLIPARQHEAVVSLFGAAARPEGVPLAAPAAGAAPPQQLEPGSVLPVEIAILGAPSVRAPGVVDPARADLLTELVIYLAAHPGGVHPNVLGAALWPRGLDAGVRDAAVARAAEWLGTDSIGRPHLAADASGRLRLGSGVRVDWQVFQALAGHAELAPAGSAEEADYLARALGLVRGRLLGGQPHAPPHGPGPLGPGPLGPGPHGQLHGAGQQMSQPDGNQPNGSHPSGGQPNGHPPPRRYAWLATDELEYEVSARVADTAHRLAILRLALRDPAGAMEAARAGLRLAHDDEMLWRDLLRAAHQTGQEHLLRAVVDEVCGRTGLDEVFLRLAPATESLMDELYPSWRSTLL